MNDHNESLSGTTTKTMTIDILDERWTIASRGSWTATVSIKK